MNLRLSFLALCCACSLAAGQSAATYDLDIEAQPLTEALKAFAQQTGLQVVFFTKIAAGHDAPAIKGKMTRDEALAALLKGTSLGFHEVNDNTVEVSEPGQKSSAVFGPRAGNIVLAQSAAVASESAPGTAGNGSISGQVIDGSTKANLPGALVRVLETGQVLATDDLGLFRLSGVPSGQYTLAISYLGYTEKLWPVEIGGDATATMNFPLEVSAWDVAEVTVFGTRSARAVALNQQRTADNSSSVVSADLLGNFTGTTISEALRHIQGVTLVRDRRTGDGTNIMIRGLEPDMNAVTLNGIDLPSTFVKDYRIQRSPDISYLLADSISKITVNYSLLPSQSSAGTGGLVEIETKSPLDRPHRYVNFGIEGARKGGDFGKDMLATATVSGTFGAENTLGLSASVQYREVSSRNFQYSVDLVYGPFLPLGTDGLPVSQRDSIDPRTFFPFEPESSRAFPTGGNDTFFGIDSQELNATVSAAWQPSENTSLRLDVTRASELQDVFTANFSEQATVPLALLPIEVLGGERRWTYDWASSGKTLSVSQYYELSRNERTGTDNVALNGNSRWGKLAVDFTLGYGRGSRDTPDDSTMNFFRTAFDDSLEGLPFVRSDALDPFENRIISPYGERRGRGYDLIRLTPAGFAFFNDPKNYLFLPESAELFSQAGHNGSSTVRLGARYDVDRGPFEYVEVGGEFKRSTFRTDRLRLTGLASADPFCGSCITLDSLGLSFDDPALAAIGIDEGGFNLISRGSFESFLNRIPALSTGPNAILAPVTSSLVNPHILEQFTHEENLGTYIEGRVDFGKLSIIGGVRVARSDVEEAVASSPHVYLADFSEDLAFARRFARLIHMSGTATDVLPRVQLNFRQTDNLIFRGAYFLTVARPSLQDLSSNQFLAYQLSAFDPATGTNTPLLQLSQGTPGLEPASTDNFDLSVEYYQNQLGLLRLSGFYKLTRNLLETNTFTTYGDLSDTVLPDSPYFRNLPSDLRVERSQPANSPDDAHLWGIEGGIERQFGFLPGFWSGLGVYTNLTYTDGSKVLPFRWFFPGTFDGNGNYVPGKQLTLRIPGQPYSQQSKYSGTAALTYNKYNIDATLSYTEQSRAGGTGFSPYGLSGFSEKVSSLDLRVARQMSIGTGRYTVFIEGSDLLKGTSNPSIEDGVRSGNGSTYYSAGGFIGGRQLRLGASASF